MKGKVTKDILLRVGQGVMRIPRSQENSAMNDASQVTSKKTVKPSNTPPPSSDKTHRS